MPKDYKNIKPKKKTMAAGHVSPVKSFFTGLMIGLSVSVMFYFYQDGITEQVQIIQPRVTLKNPEPETNPANETPPPSFDFYEILPNMEVNVSEWEAEEDEVIEKQTAPSAEKSGVYLLQIGSFKQYAAADEVKAKLALMGISADIQRVVINGKDIRHRVRVGPFADAEKLSLVRQQLATNNLSYMLLKLK